MIRFNKIYVGSIFFSIFRGHTIPMSTDTDIPMHSCIEQVVFIPALECPSASVPVHFLPLTAREELVYQAQNNAVDWYYCIK